MSFPRTATHITLLPAVRPVRLQDLTLGQVVALLRIHGGAAAQASIADLIEASPQPEKRSQPEDTCTLSILGLARVDRSGASLTGKGVEFARRILGD